MSYRKHIDDLIISKSNRRVLSGPFRGMELVVDVAWSDGDISPKLLGTYEQELHEYIYKFSSTNYDAIINIGSADGYYGVGLALIFPKIPVYLFEINELAHPIASNLAKINNVEDRIVQLGACNGDALSPIASRYNKMLIFCDIEGYEKILFSDRQILNSIKRSDVVIECHDLDDPEITGELLKHLMPTHFAQIVYSGARNPNQFGFLAHLHDSDRWLAIQEGRWQMMHWLVCQQKGI